MVLIQSIVAFGTLASTLVVAQSGGYAPSYITCPDHVKVRPSRHGLGKEEREWRSRRLPEVFKSLQSYLTNANITGFNTTEYLEKIDISNVPIAGLAISGGGSQSGMNGLGIWRAFDDRYEPAVKLGSGGLVQCLSYFTGLSGGAMFTVLPLAANNMSSVEQLRHDAANFTADYLEGTTGNVTEYYEEIFENAYAKYAEGFPVAAADILGQWVGQYLPLSMQSANVSDLGSPDTAFYKGLGPMPLVTLTEVIPGQSPEIGNITYPMTNISTIYEMSPFEFGSWAGGRVQAFVDTKYIGTNMTNGRPVNSDECAIGFDKISYAQGVSGNAFNLWFTDDFYGFNGFFKRDLPNDIPIPSEYVNNTLVELVEEVSEFFNQTFNQSLYSAWPNPFADWNEEMTNVTELLMVDGSEAGETLPLRPLIIPEREVDFIIAYDSSGEYLINDFVNGTTFGQTSKVAHNLGLPFPDVPDASTFLNLGLNRYPTFFGCDASVDIPLVLYLPNSPWTMYSNFSFEQSQFSNKQLDLVFENSLNLVTLGQGKLNTSEPTTPRFTSCIACGFIARSLERTGQSLPATCQTCFTQHCWNGTVVDNPEYPAYNPDLLLNPGLSYEDWYNDVWTA